VSSGLEQILSRVARAESAPMAGSSTAKTAVTPKHLAPGTEHEVAGLTPRRGTHDLDHRDRGSWRSGRQWPIVVRSTFSNQGVLSRHYSTLRHSVVLAGRRPYQSPRLTHVVPLSCRSLTCARGWPFDPAPGVFRCVVPRLILAQHQSRHDRAPCAVTAPRRSNQRTVVIIRQGD
jgi:hypothetical protein